MAVQVLIDLDTDLDYNDVNAEVPNPDEYPTLTHARIVNIKTEVDRDEDSKDGWIEIWLAYGYMDTGIFYEARGIDGINVLFDKQAYIDFYDDYTVHETHTMQDFLYNLSQYCIDENKIDGTVVVNSY